MFSGFDCVGLWVLEASGWFGGFGVCFFLNLYLGLVVGRESFIWLSLRLFHALHERRSQDSIIYNATISSCEKCGQWQQALAIFSAMPQAKLAPAAGLVLGSSSSTHRPRSSSFLMVHV